MATPIFLNPSEVARRLGVSTSTLSRWRFEKTGPRASKMNGRWFYTEDDVVQFQRDCIAASEQFDASSQRLRDAGAAD